MRMADRAFRSFASVSGVAGSLERDEAGQENRIALVGRVAAGDWLLR